MKNIFILLLTFGFIVLFTAILTTTFELLGLAELILIPTLVTMLVLRFKNKDWRNC